MTRYEKDTCPDLSVDLDLLFDLDLSVSDIALSHYQAKACERLLMCGIVSDK